MTMILRSATNPIYETPETAKAGTFVLLSNGWFEFILELTQDVESWDDYVYGIDMDEGDEIRVAGWQCEEIIVGADKINEHYGYEAVEPWLETTSPTLLIPVASFI